MQKGELLYEGKAKKIYRTDDPDVYLVEYKDDATAFNGLKKGTISGKGELNNRISAHFFHLLEEKGIATHFLEQVSEREMLVRTLEIIPIEVVVRNIAAGSLAKRLGLEEGTALPRPVVEYYYKSDELGDPMINDDHIAALNLATPDELAALKKTALTVNNILREYLAPRRLELVDFKLEFGRHRGKILLGDEISPDTCRFWDTRTGEKLDKDRFRRDLGGVEEAYREVWHRLAG
ncbi:phosphoribosylaminoimidazolesuccinocarboxamide synthase [Desulfofundulus thermobenzoicus]|uniref:Phosphoribosylaminoimidazole-succinocarboxamide synthase n=1 Tax=Desulfofundulus thermobenzoicus TaxID=29376 RepID=A0A6N7ITM2_9FIRM|nr:phosphoribosylaminoimidazolesuccinocarboxamide synthase [Desulfofundulus thermobenzoicus]MQL53466.1 phosphoribosylaminoimidazolesuccinocarboxamide synthase [Desulfofundulus thermobenzoicus]